VGGSPRRSDARHTPHIPAFSAVRKKEHAATNAKAEFFTCSRNFHLLAGENIAGSRPARPRRTVVYHGWPDVSTADRGPDGPCEPAVAHENVTPANVCHN
jgi:hypothetical protein